MSGTPTYAQFTISAFPDSVLRLLAGRGLDANAPQLREPASEGVWSTLGYIAHTGDAIDWYPERIIQVLTERQRALTAFDLDAHEPVPPAFPDPRTGMHSPRPTPATG